jgi:hypothetical protein
LRQKSIPFNHQVKRDGFLSAAGLDNFAPADAADGRHALRAGNAQFVQTHVVVGVGWVVSPENLPA